MTVAITKFSVDKTKIDWAYGSDTGVDVLVSSLAHGTLPLSLGGGEDKAILIVEDDIPPETLASHYPMSGGTIAQNLHRNHFRQHTLGEVQSDATDRGIALASWTQDELIELILQDECAKRNCHYYPEEA